MSAVETRTARRTSPIRFLKRFMHAATRNRRRVSAKERHLRRLARPARARPARGRPSGIWRPGRRRPVSGRGRRETTSHDTALPVRGVVEERVSSWTPEAARRAFGGAYRSFGSFRGTVQDDRRRRLVLFLGLDVLGGSAAAPSRRRRGWASRAGRSLSWREARRAASRPARRHREQLLRAAIF
jgi:hypothetical protein